MDRRDPNTWVIFHCSSHAIAGSCIKSGLSGTQTCSHFGHQYCREQLKTQCLLLAPVILRCLIKNYRYTSFKDISFQWDKLTISTIIKQQMIAYFQMQSPLVTTNLFSASKDISKPKLSLLQPFPFMWNGIQKVCHKHFILFVILQQSTFACR